MQNYAIQKIQLKSQNSLSLSMQSIQKQRDDFDVFLEMNKSKGDEFLIS